MCGTTGWGNSKVKASWSGISAGPLLLRPPARVVVLMRLPRLVPLLKILYLVSDKGGRSVVGEWGEV